MAKKKPPDFTDEPGPVLHSARWRFGEFELDEGKRELSRNGQPIELEPKPFNMLMLMLRHPGELIAKSDLMEALWTGRIVTESVLTNCAAKLRSVLGDEDPAVRLRTLHGYGYRLEANPQLVTAEAPLAAEPPSFAEGQVVPFRPNWRLKRRLGVSGETWLAEQPVSREQRVFKFALTPRSLSALKREVTLYRLLRQTLEARVPVVDILDWNFDEPPWFIEAEYCELGSLAEYLDSLGGARALPLPARLGMVIQLAEALAQVHAVGILHKDLKPANVLVAAASAEDVCIKLGDFGAGRLLDYGRLELLAITRLGFTQFSETGGSSSSSSGTPLYYAPEVLSGQPATLKADIYALGVILYQLVVGDLRRLFAPGWEAGVEDELIREDIAACAAGDPALRLPDALLLAQRLRTLPARRQQRARERAEREAAAATVLALKEARARRKGLQLAAGALALGLAASLLLFWQARSARIEAQAATRQAIAARDFVLKDVLGKVVKADAPVAGLTVSQLLIEAGKLAGERFKNEPLLESQVRHQLGGALEELQQREDSAKELRIALARGGAALAKADPETYVELVAARMVNDYNGGNFEPTYDELLRLHEASKKLVPPGHKALMKQIRALTMAQEDAGRFLIAEQTIAGAMPFFDSGDPRTQISMRRILGRIQMGNGKLDAAKETLQQALARAQLHYGGSHLVTADVLFALAKVGIYSGDLQMAEQHLSKARDITAQWEPTPGEMTLTLIALQGTVAVLKNDFSGARQILKRFEQILSTLAPDLKRRARYHQYLQALLAAKEARWPDALAQAQACLGTDMGCATGLLRLEVEQLEARALIETGQAKAALKALDALDTGPLKQMPTTHFLRQQQRELRARLLKAS